MSWITPKTDWTSADGVDFNDLNRIEGDIAFIATNPSGLILQLAPDGGNVGIGIVSPTSKLHVDKDLSLKGTSDADANIEFASDADLLWDESADEFVLQKRLSITNRNLKLKGTSDADANIKFASDADLLWDESADSFVMQKRLMYSSKRITSANYIHGNNIAYSTQFTKLSPFIPNTGDEMLVSGVWAGNISGPFTVVSRVKRLDASTIEIYGVANTNGLSSISTITSATTLSAAVSLSW